MSNLGFMPGDIIIFEATGEVCILTDKFDVYAENAEERVRQGRIHRPTWAWHGVWTRPEDLPCPGPWQSRLEPKVESHLIDKYGMSATNLFNFLSHARARKEGKVIRVPDPATPPMPKENDP